MKKYTTVIFDLDGTLLDTIEDLTDGVNYAMEKYGLHKWEIKDIKSFVGNGIRNLIIKSVPQGEDNPQFEEIFKCFREYYTSHCQIKTKAYDEILELLDKLQNMGIKMAIVSNKTDVAVKELNEIYFDKYISTAIGERKGVSKKPAPDSVNEAMKILGVKKEEALYIGDSEVDIQTANNAELDCILVTWGFRDKEQMKDYNPVAFIDSPMELLEYIC